MAKLPSFMSCNVPLLMVSMSPFFKDSRLHLSKLLFGRFTRELLIYTNPILLPESSGILRPFQ